MLVFLTLILLSSCQIFEKNKGSLLGGVVKLTTETALKKVFKIDYLTIKDSIKIEKEVHYLEVEKYTGEEVLQWFTYEGYIEKQTLKSFLGIYWKYNPVTQKINFIISIKKKTDGKI